MVSLDVNKNARHVKPDPFICYSVVETFPVKLSIFCYTANSVPVMKQVLPVPTFSSVNSVFIPSKKKK